MNRLQLCLLISLQQQGNRLVVPFLWLLLLFLETFNAIWKLLQVLSEHSTDCLIALIYGKGPFKRNVR